MHISTFFGTQTLLLALLICLCNGNPVTNTSPALTTQVTGLTTQNTKTGKTNEESRTSERLSQSTDQLVKTTENPNTQNVSESQVNETETGSGDEDENKNEGTEEEGGVELIVVQWSAIEYPLIITLVVIFAGLSKLVFHYSHFLSSKVPESSVLIVLGVISGVVLYYTGVTKDVKLYAPHLFFLYLLPPIVLEAAYGLYDRTFAENIGGVLLFAVLGTVLNFLLIGFTMYGLYLGGAMEVDASLVQILLFAALIVAVDPVAVLAVFQEVGVNDMLYFLVFGESLLNDGVTVVLYDVMQIFITMNTITAVQILLGVVKFFIVVVFGLLIGVICALCSSFITKYTNSVKVVEPLIVFGFAYLSYVLSDMFEFSGIISLIACGILQVHYTFQNITKKSRQSIKFFSKVMSNASEIIVFLDLGIVTINLKYDWNTGFALWALLLCIVYRFIVTYSLSASINRFSSGRIRKIRLDEMFMISYGGLRGAVCFSLVALIDESHVPMKNMFVTTTLFIIFFTVFIQGGTIRWLVRKLRVKLAEGDPQMNLNKEISSHVFDYIMAGIEQIAGYTTGDHHIKKKLDKLDNAFIRPKFLKHSITTEVEDISRCYEKVVMKEHYKNLQVTGAKLPKVDSATVRQLEKVLSPDRLDDEDSSTGSQSYENLVKRMERHNREENLGYGDNVHMFLKQTMDTVRDRIHFKDRDKNMTHGSDTHLATQIRLKERYTNEIRNMRHASDSNLFSAHASSGSNSLNVDGAVVFTDTAQVKSLARRTENHSNEEKASENEGFEIMDEDGVGTGTIVFTL